MSPKIERTPRAGWNKLPSCRRSGEAEIHRGRQALGLVESVQLYTICRLRDSSGRSSASRRSAEPRSGAPMKTATKRTVVAGRKVFKDITVPQTGNLDVIS